MEHPYLILTSVFSIFGLEEWAASNAHVTYMWLCMITLIFFGWLAGKSVSMVPGTAQNVPHWHALYLQLGGVML